MADRRRPDVPEWTAPLLDELCLTGTERVVHLGCGSGSLTIAVARRLTTGRVTGVHPWPRGGGVAPPEVAVARAVELAGVGPRVRLVAARLAAVPLASGSADVVVSGPLAVPDAERRAAVREAWRVLAPGGQLHLVGMRRYADELRAAGAVDVEERDLGRPAPPRWPWARLGLLSASKQLVLEEPAAAVPSAAQTRDALAVPTT
jgi:arsenite methyltransferase